MIGLLLYVLVLLIFFSILFYVVRMIPLPPPFGMVAQAVIGLILLLVLLDLLLGGRFVGFPRYGLGP
jgi:asparagine N-glycosylation enzyme membrane subunit Stt3